MTLDAEPLDSEPLITGPEVRAAMDAIRQACLAVGVRLGTFGLSAAAVGTGKMKRGVTP